MSDSTNCVRRVTSSQSSLISSNCAGGGGVGGECESADTVGAATSRTLSASCTSLPKSLSVSVEARTIHTLAGSRCRNSLRRNELLSEGPSLSPISCCMSHSNCVGL